MAMLMVASSTSERLGSYSMDRDCFLAEVKGMGATEAEMRGQLDLSWFKTE